MSTCTDNLNKQSSGLEVPKMNRVGYIDTLLFKDEHVKNNQSACSYLNNEPSKNFHVFSNETLYKTWQGIQSANKGEFDYFTRELAATLYHVDCIFANLDSLLFSPNNFRKDKFDNLIKWVADMKKIGKTIILFSHYQVPYTHYLSRALDFVINCVPHQRSEYSEGCTFGVQWLKHKCGKFDPINNPPYFNIVRSFDTETKRHSWIRNSAMDFFKTNNSESDFDLPGQDYDAEWPELTEMLVQSYVQGRDTEQHQY